MDTQQAPAEVSVADQESSQPGSTQGQRAPFRQLQPEERLRLASLKQQGQGVRKIAQELGRSPATISRELRRNTDAQWGYASQIAHRRSQQRRAQSYDKRAKMDNPEVCQEVQEMLRRYWSPEQIARELKRRHPQDSRRHLHGHLRLPQG